MPAVLLPSHNTSAWTDPRRGQFPCWEVAMTRLRLKPPSASCICWRVVFLETWDFICIMVKAKLFSTPLYLANRNQLQYHFLWRKRGTLILSGITSTSKGNGEPNYPEFRTRMYIECLRHPFNRIFELCRLVRGFNSPAEGWLWWNVTRPSAMRIRSTYDKSDLDRKDKAFYLVANTAPSRWDTMNLQQVQLSHEEGGKKDLATAAELPDTMVQCFTNSNRPYHAGQGRDKVFGIDMLARIIEIHNLIQAAAFRHPQVVSIVYCRCPTKVTKSILEFLRQAEPLVSTNLQLWKCGLLVRAAIVAVAYVRIQ